MSDTNDIRYAPDALRSFAKNLYAAYSSGQERATGYWVAHSVLIVVNVAIAALLGRLGWKAFRSRG